MNILIIGAKQRHNSNKRAFVVRAEYVYCSLRNVIHKAYMTSVYFTAVSDSKQEARKNMNTNHYMHIWKQEAVD